MRVLTIAVAEFTSNWRRNAVFGAILFISVVVQLFTAISSTASQTAVETYGTAVYGYAETYNMSFEEPMSAEQLAAFNRQLVTIGRGYRWFRPATAVDIEGYVRTSGAADAASASPLTLRAVSPAWRRLTPSIPDDDLWRTVTSPRRVGAAVMLEDGTAQRLQVTGPLAVTLLVDDTSGGQSDSGAQGTGTGSGARGSASGSGLEGAAGSDGAGFDSAGSDGAGAGGAGADGGAGRNGGTGSDGGAGSDGRGAGTDPSAAAGSGSEGGGAPVASGTGGTGHRIAVRNVPVFGTYTELNKSLAADALVNQNLLALAHIGPQPVSVYWRCEGATCRDTYGLVKLAAAAVGAKPGREQRIDQLEQFRPVLAQQQKEGRRFSLVVIVLGAFAVAIVSTAFVEVRAPQFAMLRALGASRSAVGAIALLENFFTAVLVGVIAVVLGVAASYLDPNRFNQIPEIELTRLSVPVMLYARTAALTLLIGLLTGLAPAVRAYRSVRTS